MGITGRALIGGVGGLNQNAVRGIAAYSSFVHTAWIIGAIMESFFFFFLYLGVYALQLRVLRARCAIRNRSRGVRGSGLVLSGLRLIGLRGIPPFSGFVPKLLVLLSVEYKGALVGPILGSMVAIKYYVSCSCSIILDCVSVWNSRMSKFCFLFVSFSVFIYGGLFGLVHFMYK